MTPSTVQVAYHHPTTNHPESGAGVQFRNDITGDAFILVHGAVFTPLVSQTWFKDFLESLPSNIESDNKNNCRQLANRVQIHVYEENLHQQQLPGKKMVIRAAWKCPVVSNTVEKLLHDWTLGQESQGHDFKQLMDVFFVLANDATHFDFNQVVSEHILPAVERVHRGRDVLIESTPFGNPIFINSLSRGIVSNVVGYEGCLVLTDARAVTGCQGGPIYNAAAVHDRRKESEKGKLVGLVSSPITSWRGEWVGLTIGVALFPILKRLVNKPTQSIAGFLNDKTSLIDETVVLVRCGSSWGSGFVINAQKGLILTCSHVVRNNNSFNVWIVHRGNNHKASVIYRSPDEFVFDIAIIKLTSLTHSFTMEISLANADLQPYKGQDVVAAGFALFSERETTDLVATLVKGCIARTHPCMLQTTCCIQSGASGGPILTQGPEQQLVGLIVSNAQDNTSGAIFPHVNFAIPVSCFRDAIDKYIKTDDIIHLQSLTSSSGSAQSVWKLQSSKL